MLSVSPIRAFSDNYIWLIRGLLDPGLAAVVDPGDAAPVRRTLREQNLKLDTILITHHHPDHVGGVSQLVDEYSPQVFGPANETIPGSPTKLREGDVTTLPKLGMQFRVLDVPGHTSGHIAYVGHGAVFCGDTLFSGGCGRLFEGTAEQMHRSLSKLSSLPADTLVYCTHEYTLSNLKFAAAVEPANSDLAAYTERCRQLRAQDRETLPSNIGLEHTVNPFLRSALQSVKCSAEAHTGRTLQSDIEVFAAVRAWKDGFK
jgi:hydroxyacylglutathione hydrolase